jgi:hypothetical protein
VGLMPYCNLRQHHQHRRGQVRQRHSRPVRGQRWDMLHHQLP